MAPQRGIPPYPHSDMEIYKISVNEDVGMSGCRDVGHAHHVTQPLRIYKCRCRASESTVGYLTLSGVQPYDPALGPFFVF
jgi:hypothetical protein